MSIPKSFLEMEAVYIKRKSITTVLMLFAIALVFSTSTAFAVENTSNTNSSYNNTEDVAAGSPVSFTSAEINKAAYQVKTYTDNHQTLPGYVIIGDTKVTMPQFLKLMVQNVMNNGTSESVTIENFDDPKSPNSSETITNGDLTCTEYTTLARQINTYINKYGIATSSATTSLGKLNFNNLVYTFSKILTYNRTYNRLPNDVSITTWSSIINSSDEGSSAVSLAAVSSEGSSTSSEISFTTEQIICAAYKVKTYTEKYNNLPGYVIIGDTKVTMPQFLELMTDNLLAISNGSETSHTLGDVAEPTDLNQSLETGTLSKTEYIDVAKTINSYISSNDKAPGYVSTSLGNMRYETMVYSYAKILNFYKSYDRLPNTVSVTQWGTTETSQTTESSSTTIDQILKTAAKFGYSSLAHDAEGLVKYGSGDCWAMSDYLFKQFQAAGIKAKIVQYATAYASNHRSVMIYQNGSWVDVPYRTYGFNSMFNNMSGSQYGTVIAIC